MRGTEPTVSAGFAEALLKFAIGLGANRAALLDAADIRPTALADLDERLPLDLFIALINAAKAASGDPTLALRFGCEADMADASIVGLISWSGETIAESFALLNRYGPLLADVEHEGPERFRLVQDASGVWVIDTRVDAAGTPELSECTFGRLTAVGCELFEDANYVKSVHFAQAPPPHAAESEKILKTPVQFGCDADKMLLDPAVLDRRIAPRQPQYTLAILRKHADELLEKLDRPAPVRQRVEEVLNEVLPYSYYGQDQVAQRVGMSRRTLHRRLSAEGTTFEQVLDELRRKLAAQHLEAGLSVKHTARELGFSDPAAFSRAFKRWTGTSPLGDRRGGG